MNRKNICESPDIFINPDEKWHRTKTRKGNRLKALVNGEEAYPAMMEAIAGAKTSVSLSMYQFDEDAIGSKFAEFIIAAEKRGVEVRIILDAWGDLKSYPSIRARLRNLGIEVRAFHPFSMMHKINRRYHRKLLLIDGEIGFTGGMNIRDRHLVESYDGNAMRDTIFKIEGPVVNFLEALFIADWQYCGGQAEYKSKPPNIGVGSEEVTVFGAGPPFCRSGLLRGITQAIEGASDLVVAVTPFFFPGEELLQAFARAISKGVVIDLILPTGDYEFLLWCATGHLRDLIEHGGAVYLSPPPYDHSKIILVDDSVFIGTVNLDHRSLRFNWEIAMKCSGGSLVGEVKEILAKQRQMSTRLQMADLWEAFPRRLLRKFIMGFVGRFL